MKLNSEQLVLQRECYTVSHKQDFTKPWKQQGSASFLCRITAKGLTLDIGCSTNIGGGALRYKLIDAGATSS